MFLKFLLTDKIQRMSVLKYITVLKSEIAPRDCVTPQHASCPLFIRDISSQHVEFFTSCRIYLVICVVVERIVTGTTCFVVRTPVLKSQ
jgi:hypothetical protein